MNSIRTREVARQDGDDPLECSRLARGVPESAEDQDPDIQPAGDRSMQRVAGERELFDIGVYERTSS